MSATEIVITAAGPDEPMAFDVTLRDARSETRHRVALSLEDLARLTQGHDAEALIEASFRFLLDHEPKEAILARFDLSVIARYFPQYEKALPSYLRI